MAGMDQPAAIVSDIFVKCNTVYLVTEMLFERSEVMD